MHGPAEWEGPARRVGPVRRVAVFSDVHANVPALRAVLAEIDAADADLIVSCGDLTWGADPGETLALLAPYADRLVCLRGNGERAALELASGTRAPSGPREPWVAGRHDAATLAAIGAFPFSVIVEIEGLGPVRFCHGSPRCDTELITPATPAGRMAELTAGIAERILVTGHTHLTFDRRLGPLRSINPGSVGLPFHTAAPGTAYWALLGPDVDLRTTRYDPAQARPRDDDPAAPTLHRLLHTPPTPAEITTDAEHRVFSD